MSAAKKQAIRESGTHAAAEANGGAARHSATKISYAASRLPAGRLRLSAIFDEIERLTVEFGNIVDDGAVPSDVGNEICDMLTDTVVETRAMLGDELDDMEWLVAENAPLTHEAHRAEVRSRVEGVAL
ncbi:MAG TPA: hypothetical protein VK550_34750 [Polyangiaceae bacterium]|nr:hypothetical protein [Polyangiaceae bacterium]